MIYWSDSGTKMRGVGLVKIECTAEEKRLTSMCQSLDCISHRVNDMSIGKIDARGGVWQKCTSLY